MAKLIRWVEAQPDIIMPELAAKLAAGTRVVVHPASLSRALVVAGLRHKKRMARPVCKWDFEAGLIGLRKRIRHEMSQSDRTMLWPHEVFQALRYSLRSLHHPFKRLRPSRRSHDLATLNVDPA